MKKTVSSVNSPNKQAALELIRYRKQVYQRTFAKDDRMAQAVLADLANFCRARRSTFDPDARVHALIEGRREVFQRIMDHIGMTEDELYDLFVLGKK